jgi:uncharacterized protein
VSLVSGNVLVTGATGGIGQVIARAFASRGARVLLTGRRLDVLEPLASEISARAVACDLSRREDVERLIAEALEAKIEVLIANAGLPASGVLTELTQDEIDRMLEINLRAPIALARALAPAMIERRRGHMVFISSLSGKVTSPASSIYSATKFGLRGFALASREDLRRYGVGVSVVLPGFIREAGIFADAHVELPRGVGTRSPEDVASGVISAIEQNRAEVEIAPAFLRLGAGFAALAPQLAATVSRRLGGERVAQDLAAGQRDKR